VGKIAAKAVAVGVYFFDKIALYFECRINKNAKAKSQESEIEKL